MDATDDSIETEDFANGEWVQFWVKGMGTDATSSLLVEEYYGGIWSEVTDIYSLPVTGTMIGDLGMLEATTRLKFTYTKNLGDLAFDDVLVKCLITPTPTPCWQVSGGIYYSGWATGTHTVGFGIFTEPVCGGNPILTSDI